MRGNYLILNEEELEQFNNRYEFNPVEEGVIATIKTYNRSTFHSDKESFQAITEINGKKTTLLITPVAISVWKELKQKVKLIDVQNTINKAIVNNKFITKENAIKFFENT